MATEYLPLQPPERIKAKPIRQLSDSEEEKRLKVLEHFSAEEYQLPGEANGTLTEDEKFWLTNDCILRFLRASKWVLQTAIQRLESTLKWRRETDIENAITAEHVEPEALTGKQLFFGYDTQDRPGYLMIPSRQNTQEGPRQVHHVIWMLERAVDLMGPGVENLALMINFADRAKNPSMSTARQVLNILQNHYPERMGLAIVINIPWLVNSFLKLMMPFVDPVTRNKIKFNIDVVNDGFFTKDNLMTTSWNGDRNFEYCHEKYWPELLRICGERKVAQKNRWRELGGRVGIDEWDIKMGALVAEKDASTLTGTDVVVSETAL